MRILFVTLAAVDTNTSAMLRNRGIIAGLIKNGSTVEIMTIRANEENLYLDNSSNFYNGIKIRKLQENKAYFSLIQSDESFKGRMKQKIMPYLRGIYHKICLFDNTIISAKRSGKNIPSTYYDLVISSSDPKSSHIAVKTLIKFGLKYNKWIQYWGDPFTIDITKKSLHPKWYVRRIERNILSLADKIVYVSPFTLNAQKELFPSCSQKMSFLPTPYLKVKIYDSKDNRNSDFTIGYFGDYQSSIRNIGPLYNYVKKSESKLIIAGSSDLDLEKDHKISILPRVTQKKVSELEAKSDILVCILNKSGTQIPGKIYHYAATNKPILVLMDGDNKSEISAYLSSFNRFILCDNNESDINQMVDKIRNDNQLWQPSPFFSPERIGKKFIEL